MKGKMTVAGLRGTVYSRRRMLVRRREEAGPMFELKKTLRGLSEDDVLADLRRCASELGRDTLTMLEYERIGKGHPTSICRRFGSWCAALERAGLGPSRSKMGITEDELFDNLKEIWIKLGRQPSYSELKKPLSAYSSGTYENRFGTWSNALQSFVSWVNGTGSDAAVALQPEVKDEACAMLSRPHRTCREISDRQRFRILMRDGFACSSCGASPQTQRGVQLHVDHIMPWSKGGETVDENLQSKCGKCNLGKGNAFDA